MYYVAKNHYASQNSVGYGNAWYVIAFATKKARDAHVINSDDMATRPISSKQLKMYSAAPGKVSYYDAGGVFWQHMGNGDFCAR